MGCCWMFGVTPAGPCGSAWLFTRGVPLRPEILAEGGIGLRDMAAADGPGEPVPLFAGVPVRLCSTRCAAAAIAALGIIWPEAWAAAVARI